MERDDNMIKTCQDIDRTRCGDCNEPLPNLCKACQIEHDVWDEYGEA